MSHDHGQPATAAAGQRDRLKLVLAITLVILTAEVVGGVLAHSLVLIADAGHVATDAAGIGLSLLAVHFAVPAGQRRPDFRLHESRDPGRGDQRRAVVRSRRVHPGRGGGPAGPPRDGDAITNGRLRPGGPGRQRRQPAALASPARPRASMSGPLFWRSWPTCGARWPYWWRRWS